MKIINITKKKQITELKKSMQAYITASKACDKAETEMIITESEYKAQFSAYMDVSKRLSDLVGISEKEARAMVNTKEAEIITLIEKLGA